MCILCATFTPYLTECQYGALDTATGEAAEAAEGVAAQGPTETEQGDAAGSTGTTAQIGVAEYFLGTLASPGDTDWIEVELTAGQVYTIALTGTGALGSSNDDPILRLRDSSGIVIETDDDGGPGAYSDISFTASYTGRYYIDVQAKPTSIYSSTPDTGTYGVSVTEGSRASFNAEMGAGTLLRPDLAWTSSAGTGATVTWSVRASGIEPSGGNPFVVPSSNQVSAIQETMAYVDALSGLTLNQVNPGGTSNAATIVFGAYSAFDGSGAYAYYPGQSATWSVAGDIWLNNTSVSTTSLSYGTFSSFVLLHEIGHAIGLAHPGDYNAMPGVTFSYANTAQFVEDSHQYTVMSYFDETNTGASSGLGYPDTFMLYDLLALHTLYGADPSYNAGDTTYGYNATMGNSVYDFDTNRTPFLTIYDGSGDDTIDVSEADFFTQQVVDLNQGAFSNVLGYSGNLSIAYGARIENAIGGAGRDTLYGNAERNDLDGGEGDDELRGSTNADTLRGGAGDDTLYGNTSTDLLYGNAGADELRGGDGVDTLYGGDDGDYLIGHKGWDLLFGGAGDDELRGSSGADSLEGEDGNDTLHGGTGEDTLDAGRFADVLYGNQGADTMRGRGGNDELFGGSGIDTLSGGADDDTLWGNEGADSLRGDDGFDLIYGGTGDDLERGGAGNDTLFGGQGRDTLDGGTGDDFLRGGTLPDTFIYTEGADQIDDFNLSVDKLILEDALWGGGLTAAEVEDRFGAEDTLSGDYVFDFGGGNTLTLNGGTDPDLLVPLIGFM